ncbi:MAG: hypothetical protein OER88_04815 [Planctomycetota bacterium]|nr:hypothetical protein [Planctomycetota bacterium]
MTVALVVCAALEVVAGDRALCRVESDASPMSRHAADLFRRHVVWMTGVALPERGPAVAVRFERSAYAGYRIKTSGLGLVIEGDDLVRAAYDILEGWGCRFDRAPPAIPKRTRLALDPRAAPRARTLYLEGGAFDEAVPGHGLAVRGLTRYDEKQAAAVRRRGYAVRVASDTFDDFLSPKRFEEHPEWFALRRGKRVPRGNFALREAGARAAYLDALGTWLEAHPDVTCVGIWPEVTTVWDERALELGAPESYALLWREAARRFPTRRFEILATGLTLSPPRDGAVPPNVEVRLRPGRDASGLQPLAGQDVEAVVNAWRARGARLLLEIDAAPTTWCGLSWPCHDALRGNAKLFDHAVLVRGDHNLARLWRAPDEAVELGPRLARLLERAERVRSWGAPADAADLFTSEDDGPGYHVGATERALRRAGDAAAPAEERRKAARAMYLAYRDVLATLPQAARYRRYRERAIHAAFAELLPDGVSFKVGPATVRESLARVDVETDRLALRIDRATATVVAARRRIGREWSPWLGGDAGALFTLATLAKTGVRVDGDVTVSSPETGVVHIAMKGRFGASGPTWTNRLAFRNGSGAIRQTATTVAHGGVVLGCRFSTGSFTHWVCPPHAAEGSLVQTPVFLLPPATLLYLRRGERGLGLALRLPRGGRVQLTPRTDGAVFYTTSRQRNVVVEWILFERAAELGR